MSLADINKLIVFLFTVTNLAALGLEMKPAEAIKTLKKPVFIILTLVWGWIIGPALALLIVLVLPLSASHAAGLILISLAPMTPAYPVMVGKAHGDMSAAGAFTIIATIGTVLFLPVMVPWLIPGMTVSIFALAKPLLIYILLPLLIGLALRIYAVRIADMILPLVKKTGVIFLVLCAVLTTWIYRAEMIDALGSFAIGALVLFLVLLTIISYKIGFGLNQGQRSAMSLGMCTRNISAAFVAYFGITNPDPGILVIIILLIPITIIVGFTAAGIYARQVKGLLV